MNIHIDFTEVYGSGASTPLGISRHEFLDSSGFAKEARYVYHDELGRPAFRIEVWRNAQGEKQLNSVPTPGRRGVRCLFNLPAVLRAIDEGEEVWLTEGERDAERLIGLGIVATTAPYGASHWAPEYSEQLDGAYLIIAADKDAPGKARAIRLVTELERVVADVQVVVARAGKDICDHLDAGFSLLQLRRWKEIA